LSPRQFLGALVGYQIGAGGRTHDQRPAGEHPDLTVTVEQQERQVLVGVTGCQQRTQAQPAEIDLVAVVEAGVGEFAVPRRGGQHLGSALRAELVCAGKEIGVQMGVGGERHRQAAPCRRGMHGTQVTADVDDQGTSIAEVDEIGGVAQSFVDKWNQIDS
jgi:hypothetical protein